MRIIVEKKAETYHRLCVTRIDHDVYVALGAEDSNRGGRRQMEIINEALRAYLLPEKNTVSLELPDGLMKSIAFWAEYKGVTPEQQILEDLCEIYEEKV